MKCHPYAENLRMLGERVVEVKRDIYVCFLDHTKAINKERHGKMLEILQIPDIDEKISNLSRIHTGRKLLQF